MNPAEPGTQPVSGGLLAPRTAAEAPPPAACPEQENPAKPFPAGGVRRSYLDDLCRWRSSWCAILFTK
jgi:hypothetical protein